MIREIVKFPHPVLRTAAAPVGKITPEIRQLVADMGETMYARGGVGLAAPQVGVGLRIFVVIPEVAGRPESEAPMVFIDSLILSAGQELVTADEGCLSFPDTFVPIRRAASVRMEARNLDGETFTVDAAGLYARVILHEHDHVNGLALWDRVGPTTKRRIAQKFALT